MQHSSTHLFFVPGLWANTQDYSYLLMQLAKKFDVNNKNIYKLECSDLISKSKNIIKEYSYKGCYVRFQKLFYKQLRRINDGDTVIFVGHSLGGAVVLGLGASSRFNDLIDERNFKVKLIALNSGGIKINSIWPVIKYWTIIPLMYLLSRYTVGSIIENILQEVLKNGIFMPIKHFHEIVNSAFLEILYDSNFAKSKNIKTMIVNSTNEELIPMYAQEQIIMLVKPDEVVKVQGLHGWPINFNHVDEFIELIRS